jgi:hypothetical protein
MGFCIGLILPADSGSNEYQGHFRGQRRPVRKGDNLTTFMCWLSRNSESFNLQELYPYLIFYKTYIPVKVFEPKAAVQEWIQRESLYDGPIPKLAYFVTFLPRGGQDGDLPHQLTPRSRVILAKLTVPQLDKKCPALSQQPATCPSSSPLHILFKIDFNIILPSTFLPSDFPTKTLYLFLFSYMWHMPPSLPLRIRLDLMM